MTANNAQVELEPTTFRVLTQQFSYTTPYKHSNRFNTDLVTNDSKYSARVDRLQGSVMDSDCLRPVSQEDPVAVLCLVQVQRVYRLVATMDSSLMLSVGKVERGLMYILWQPQRYYSPCKKICPVPVWVQQIAINWLPLKTQIWLLPAQC